jgi:hypothetical protein
MVRTKEHNTATVDVAVLATSNGYSGMNRHLGFGSTSVGSLGSAPPRQRMMLAERRLDDAWRGVGGEPVGYARVLRLRCWLLELAFEASTAGHLMEQ